MRTKKSTIICLFAVFAAAKLSSSSPVENDGQLYLIGRLDGLESKIDQLVNQLEQEKLLRGNLQSRVGELEKEILELGAKNAKKTERLEAKIDLLMTRNVQQDEDINQLKNKIKEYVADSNQPAKLSTYGEDKRMQHINDAGGMLPEQSSPRLPPSSCRQLSTIGHNLDGIYLVANPDTNKIETVYCDFGSSTLSETLYGSVDVKTKSVHFYVQRAGDFNVTNSVVPFNIERLNLGGAMDLATGVFTVPVNGIYHFESFGLKEANDLNSIYIALQVNGVDISSSYALDYAAVYRGLSGISASLRLKTGDQVRLFKTTGTLNDEGGLFTHFSGSLIEEDLVLG